MALLFRSTLLLLNCLHHCLFQMFFFLQISSTIYFPWLFILEHLFFNCLISCCNINIHHIHICSDYLCHNNKLNLYYETSFAFQQTVDNLSFYVDLNHRCGMHMKMSYVVFDLVAIFYGYHCGLFFILFTCLHIVIIP